MIGQQGKERSQQSYSSERREDRTASGTWNIVYGFAPATRVRRSHSHVVSEGPEDSPFQSRESRPFEAKITGPAKFIKLVAERWLLSNDEAAALFGLTGSAELEQVVRGLKTLSSAPDIRNRIDLVIQIRSDLDGYLNRNLDAERTWLQEFRLDANEPTPIALLRTGQLGALARVQAMIRDYFGK